MSHNRKAIRDKVVEMLEAIDGIGTADLDLDGRVFSNRVVPVLFKNLPIVNVYCKTESVSPLNVAGPYTHHRDLDLIIEVVAKDADESTVDDTLDEIAYEIEGAMDSDPTLGATVYDSQLTRSEFDSSIEGEQPIGWLRMTYRARYKSRYQENQDD